jgi:hydrogenase nickel incorporation protein HypA/HybF
MHEQSVVESMLALALENAKKAEASRIVKIHLVVGELSGVVAEAVSFYFGFLSRDTIAARANLCFRHVPVQLRCRQCDTIFNPEKPGFQCPVCQESQVEIVAGRELYMDSLEVE